MRLTQNSVRLPSFWGPSLLASALLLVSSFSVPFWQNFYLVEARQENASMKGGAWGVCSMVKGTNTTVGPTKWCTSAFSGYDWNIITNTTGAPTLFPYNTTNDNVLLGLGETGPHVVSILTSGKTSLCWLHVVAAIFGILGIATLAIPPAKLGPEESVLHRFQKGGTLPVILLGLALLFSFVTFIADLTTAISAKNALNTIEGVEGRWGNTHWFALPCVLLFAVSLTSALMTPSPNEYQDL